MTDIADIVGQIDQLEPVPPVAGLLYNGPNEYTDA